MKTANELVREGYKCFSEGNIDGLLALCADDVEFVSNGPASIKKCNAYKGHSGIRQFFKILGESWELSSFAPREFIVAGDTVTVLGEEAGRDKTSGVPFQCRWAHVFDIRNGKLVRFREFLCHWAGDQKPPAMTWSPA